MKIPMVLKVHTSSAFTSSKDGKKYVKISCTGAGFGLFQFIAPEGKVPDDLEGKELKAVFSLYIGRDFSVRFGFDKIEGYAN